MSHSKLAAFRARNPHFKEAGYFQNIVGFDDPAAARHDEAIQALRKARAEGDAWSKQFDTANTGGRMSMYTSQMKRDPARPEQRLTRGIVGGLAGGYAGLGISMLAKGRAKAPLAVAGALSGTLAGALAPGKKREVYTKNPWYDQEAHRAYLQQHPGPDDEFDVWENSWQRYGPKNYEDFGNMGKYTEIPELLFGRDSAELSGDVPAGHKGYVTREELQAIRERMDGWDEQTTTALDRALASGRKYFTSSDFG